MRNEMVLPGYDPGRYASLQQLRSGDLIELTLDGETRPYRVTSFQATEDLNAGQQLMVYGVPLDEHGRAIGFPRELLASTSAHVVRRLIKTKEDG